MPIYQYKCFDCHTIFEELVANNKQKIICLNCSGENIKKIPSGFSMSEKSEKSGCGGKCGDCRGCHSIL